MEPELPDQIRTPGEVARRALALFGVIAVAFDADREEVIKWLRDNHLFDEPSPLEAEFIADLGRHREGSGDGCRTRPSQEGCNEEAAKGKIDEEKAMIYLCHGGQVT